MYDDVPVTDSEEEVDLDVADEEKRVTKKKQRKENLMKHADRTIFVGNLPKDINTDDLKKVFKKYGSIDTARLRSAPVSDTRVPESFRHHVMTFGLNFFWVFNCLSQETIPRG